MGALRVGCVGLGTMGGPMASSVIRAGIQVVVFDVRPEATERLKALGAATARSVTELADQADILAVTVLNDSQLESVVIGDELNPGALSTIHPGSVIVVHSTVTPTICERLASLAAARGVGFVDAPVSGGEQGAIDGTLTLMVGGDSSNVETCRPYFDAVGSIVYHLGGPGAGQLGKLVNNLIGIATRVIVREGLALARAAGLNEETTLNFVRHSSGNSWQIENWRGQQLVAARAIGGAEAMAKIAQKDLDLALGLASKMGLELPVTAEASRRVAGMFGMDG